MMQHEKNGTWQDCKMKKEQHEKSITRKNKQNEKNATWKKCFLKKCKLPQWDTEKVYKNSAL